MNKKLTTQPIFDIQNTKDVRNIALKKVGIKQLLHPVLIEDGNLPPQYTVAKFSMFVSLAAHIRGTHMSRFIEILNEAETKIGVLHTPIILDKIITKLESDNSYYEASFPYFMTKYAPVSGVKSLMDYQVILSGKLEATQSISSSLINQITVIVPVTSLCPCSKRISDYGAHNQRAEITVKAVIHHDNKNPTQISIQTLIQIIERQATCELYGILKRSDEKWVTEKAYDNPKFVEDVVRDIAMELNKLEAILSYEITSENFESIHNHSAYALIRSGEVI